MSKEIKTIRLLIIVSLALQTVVLVINAWDFAIDHQEFMIERAIDQL